jgi:hypothetical protein
MSRYLPIAVGVAAIVVLTVVQSLMSDRFVDSNVTAEQRAALLKNVPLEIGEWTGKDLDVTEEVRDTAGAVGCISREYTNGRTGERVNLWLIVGHARDISAHTPEICYRGSGFTMRSDTNSLYPFTGQHEPAHFWTNTFTKEDINSRELIRVYWAWHNPQPGAPVAWAAERYPRWKFGNTRALFKMYFTSRMKEPGETAEDSAAARFGRDFLPVINRVLADAKIGDASSDGAQSAESTAGGSASAAAG